MSVASHAQALEHEAVVAGEGCGRGNDALAEEGERLRGLEGGAGRILPHDAAVEQRLPRVAAQLAVALGALSPDHEAWVVARRADHAEHLARLGLQGDDGAYLALHEPLAQCLQLVVDGQGELLPRHGTPVEGSVLIAALYAPVGIAQENLHPLLATQLLLVEALHTQLAYIVAGLVVVVRLDVGRRHLGHVAQHVGRIGILILADAAPLHVEARETVHLLLEDGELLVRQLVHKHLLGEARVAGILRAVHDSGHTLHKLLTADAQCLAELKGVQMVAHLVDHHHDVVGRLVVDEQLSVAVGDDATRGKLHFLQEGVAVCTLLVVLTRNLQGEETYDIDRDDDYGHGTDDILTVFECVVFHFLSVSRVKMSSSVSTALPPAQARKCCQLK